MNGAREAYTCLPPRSSSSNPSEDYDGTGTNMMEMDMKEATKFAIVKDVNGSIELSQWEERLFQTLVDAAVAYETDSLVINAEDVTVDIPKQNKDSSGVATKPIEIRIAGGWVRDKIMKQESHDVDIALDSMSGHQFATIVQQHLIQQMKTEMDVDVDVDADEDADANVNVNDKVKVDKVDNGDKGGQKKKTKKGGSSKSKKPKIAVIAANPSQSKHLETATMRVHGIDCDFVHLRGGEVYASDSRIPTLKENATPLDDALRRDFTVNSLFYNLRNETVEDWTGRGVKDLVEDKLLVTPLDATITFHDDPLRVLRAVRFAVRYDLALSEEIVTAAKSTNVHESLHVKVSRERVGKELEGMLSGKCAKPCAALRLLTDLKLAGCVFEFPHDPSIAVEGELKSVVYDRDGITETEQRQAREMGWLDCAELIQYTTPLLNAVRMNLESFSIQVDKRIYYLSTFLYPLRNLNTIDAKGKCTSLPSYIIRDSIKFKNKDVQAVTTLLEHVDELRDIFNGVSSDQNGNENGIESSTRFCRLRVGLVLRNLKDLWGTALLVAAIVEINSPCSDIEGQPMLTSSQSQNVDTKVHEIALKIHHFLEVIRTHKLDGSWKTRPLMDGKDLSKSLDLPRGPLIGTYIQEQVEWMLLNPNGTRADCEIHLKAVRKHELDMTMTSPIVGKDDDDDDITMIDNGTSCSEEPSTKKAHLAS